MLFLSGRKEGIDDKVVSPHNKLTSTFLLLSPYHRTGNRLKAIK